MKLFHTIAGLKCQLNSLDKELKIALVPTMGALHPGHQSLIKRAVAEANYVIVSIFVNPLQFNPHEDLNRYPRQLKTDQDCCQSLGVDLIFAPSAPELYGSQDALDTTTLTRVTQVIPPQAMTQGLCGSSRPGHFEGVATIVMKLFQIIQPDLAYFGEKDAQQLAIIRRLVRDLNVDVEIRGCPIVRETSGLAYSSRNQYLSPAERQEATILYQSLQQAKQAFEAGERAVKPLIDQVNHCLQSLPSLKIDYVAIVEPESLQPLETIEEQGLLAISAYLGSTRLIDNLILRHRQPIIAIDGPAGAGKSTVTRQIAQRLNLLFLDTGAMYRAVTWLVLQQQLDLADEGAIAELLAQSQLELIPPVTEQDSLQVKMNGEDITTAIRTPEVTRHVSTIARQNAVREELVRKQQKWGKRGGIVAEGRDIGTHVFPDADLKIFLTASVGERARRRLQDLQNQGYDHLNLQELEAEIQRRDEQDSQRKIAPLKKAPDAIEVITDQLTIEEVVCQIIDLLK